MRKGPLSFLLICASVVASLQSCRNDEYLATAPPPPDQSFVEQFDTMQNAFNRGWRWTNRSLPIGPSVWTQVPGTPEMSAYSSRGTNQGAAYADYLSTSGTNNGTISNWLISPSLFIKNGDRIIFYTRSAVDATAAPATDYGARMQVCLNENGDDLNVGNGDDAGNFGTVLLDINGNEDEHNPTAPIPTSYPGNWTRFEATVFGLNAPMKRRFAFRYYLHGAGSNGAGNGIGIDSVAFISKK
jgi:hypothetical protein